MIERNLIERESCIAGCKKSDMALPKAQRTTPTWSWFFWAKLSRLTIELVLRVTRHSGYKAGVLRKEIASAGEYFFKSSSRWSACKPLRVRLRHVWVTISFQGENSSLSWFPNNYLARKAESASPETWMVSGEPTWPGNSEGCVEGLFNSLASPTTGKYMKMMMKTMLKMLPIKVVSSCLALLNSGPAISYTYIHLGGPQAPEGLKDLYPSLILVNRLN